MLPPYKIKQPSAYDLYEGEFETGWMPETAYRAIFRASAKFYDGYIREDKRVQEYVQRCNLVSQKFGLYHFLLPNDISRQVDVFMATVSKVGLGHMPLILDVEVYPKEYNLSNATWQAQS